MLRNVPGDPLRHFGEVSTLQKRSLRSILPLPACGLLAENGEARKSPSSGQRGEGTPGTCAGHRVECLGVLRDMLSRHLRKRLYVGMCLREPRDKAMQVLLVSCNGTRLIGQAARCKIASNHRFHTRFHHAVRRLLKPYLARFSRDLAAMIQHHL